MQVSRIIMIAGLMSNGDHMISWVSSLSNLKSTNPLFIWGSWRPQVPVLCSQDLRHSSDAPSWSLEPTFLPSEDLRRYKSCETWFCWCSWVWDPGLICFPNYLNHYFLMFSNLDSAKNGSFLSSEAMYSSFCSHSFCYHVYLSDCFQLLLSVACTRCRVLTCFS